MKERDGIKIKLTIAIFSNHTTTNWPFSSPLHQEIVVIGWELYLDVAGWEEVVIVFAVEEVVFGWGECDEPSAVEAVGEGWCEWSLG